MAIWHGQEKQNNLFRYEYVSMVSRFFYGVLMPLLWSLPFAVPFWLPDFSAVDVVFGRFLLFGLTALVILPFRLDSLSKLTPRALRHHIMMACTGHLFFYLLLVAAIRSIGPFPVCMILGALPVLSCFVNEVGTRTDARYGLMTLLAVLSIFFALEGCTNLECVTSGITFLLLAMLLYFIHARLQKNYMGFSVSTQCNLDDSDHLLLSGLVIIPCLLLLLPLGLLGDSLFVWFDSQHEPGRWRLFWLCAVLSGFVGTLVVKVLWRYKARTSNPWVMKQLHGSLPLISVIFILALTGYYPAGADWAALASLAAAFYLFFKLKNSSDRFQA